VLIFTERLFFEHPILSKVHGQARTRFLERREQPGVVKVAVRHAHDFCLEVRVLHGRDKGASVCASSCARRSGAAFFCLW